ncbi:MAG: PfkB family carbohydrate kinase [Pseudomonadota bacterium]
MQADDGPADDGASPRRIAVVGNINADHIYRLHGTLAPGQEILVKDLGLRLGGSGANAGSWLAVAGDEVHLFGRVGRDDRGRHILAQAEAYPWDQSSTLLHDGPTNHCMILIDESGDRTILGFDRDTVEAAFPSLDPYSLDALYFASARAVPNNVARVLTESQLPVVAQLHCANRLPYCDIVVASDQNFGDAEGEDWWGALSRRDIDTRWLVVTLGARGAWATDGTDVLTVPITRAPRVIDTTGAGDAFAAGLVCAVARGWSIKAALTLGSQWGADAVSLLASGCPPDHEPNTTLLR